LDLAHFDLENAIQKKLKDQLKLSMDIEAAAAFKDGQLIAVPTGVSALTILTDGINDTAGVAGMNMFHVESIRDAMYSTYNIAPYSGDDYVCILSTQAKRSLIRDPAWVDWKKYTDPAAKYNGEVGRIENIRFVETNHTSALAQDYGTGDVVGEAVFFGEDPVVMGVVEDPHLRLKEPGDYGRSKGVAWYGNYGFGQVWTDSANAGEARVMYFSSTNA
jgi:N4-gp56 family major capsid protein